MSGYTIIDVDTHVTETPDVWTSRVPATMKDRVPRIDLDAKGRHGDVNAGSEPRASSAVAAPDPTSRTPRQEDRHAQHSAPTPEQGCLLERR